MTRLLPPVFVQKKIPHSSFNHRKCYDKEALEFMKTFALAGIVMAPLLGMTEKKE